MLQSWVAVTSPETIVLEPAGDMCCSRQPSLGEPAAVGRSVTKGGVDV